MSLKSRVIAVRDIGPGESVGYMQHFTAERPARVATVPMGYADGLRLTEPNRGAVLINGRRTPVVGRMMMDCVVVDVTSLPSVRLGDEAVVIDIRTLAVIAGRLPGRALGLTVEWAAQHTEDLLKLWEEARAARPLGKLPPLG